MAGVDPLLLVVAGGVASQLEDLGGEILHDGCQVDWGAGTDTLGIVPNAEETVNSSHGKLKPSTGGAALGLSTGFASLSTSRHDTWRIDELLVRIELIQKRIDLLPEISAFMRNPVPAKDQNPADRNVLDQSNFRYADGPTRI